MKWSLAVVLAIALAAGSLPAAATDSAPKDPAKSIRLTTVSVNDLLEYSADNRLHYVLGVYDAWVFAAIVYGHKPCAAPYGTSNGTTAAMIVDHLKIKRKEWGDEDAASSIAVSVCQLWPAKKDGGTQ